MARTNKAKEKFDIKKGIADIEEAAAEVDDTNDGDDKPDGNTVLSALDTFSKALRGFFSKSESVSDDTDELAGEEDEHAAFGRQRNSKGAKGKKMVDTHEGMEPTGQEDEDRESDESDGASETANSAEPTGDRDAPNPTKRRRKVDLPQEFRTGYKSNGAKDGDAAEDENDLEKGIAEEALEDLAADENFAEVVEASQALQALTDTVIKGLARMEARQIRFEARMTKSLNTMVPVLKSIAGIDPDGEDEDEAAAADDGGGKPIKKARGAAHEANPGILAIIDGKEMRVALPDGYQGRVSKSKGSLSAEKIADIKERLAVEMEKGNIDPEVLRSFDAHGVGALASLSSEMQKSLGVEVSLN